eukprot:12735761-Ditylum_brightwellii.AAC.1
MSGICSILKDIKKIKATEENNRLMHMWQCNVPDIYSEICQSVTESNRSLGFSFQASPDIGEYKQVYKSPDEQ